MAPHSGRSPSDNRLLTLKGWQPFLPAHAVVMGRTARQSLDPALAPASVPTSVSVIFVVNAPLAPAARQLLDRMIEAMGLKPGEALVCEANQLPETLPKALIALGESAAQSLLQSQASLPELRGDFHACRGTRLLATFHPASLLQSPELKREAWADLQKVARELGIQLPLKK